LTCVVIALIRASAAILLAHWISWFSRNPPAVDGGVPESQRGAPNPAWSLIIQAPVRVVADDSVAADGQVGGELAMRDRRPFRHSAVREAVGW
jgi:hypothetical protein